MPLSTDVRMSQLLNHIAVVTGAGRGIGRAIALKFAAEGADIVCVSRTAENSERVAVEVRALGRKAWCQAVDVADPKAVATAGETISRETGRVDILVNNAGVTRDGLSMRMSEEDWDTVLNTNLKGAFLFTKAFARGFIKQRAGRIINISSIIGLIGNAGQCNYAASKAGLIGFTKSIARELASRGITVNAVAPGPVETEGVLEVWKTPAMIANAAREVPLRRLGRPEEIAHAVIFAASDGAGFMTGETVYVSGGPRTANRED